MHPLLNIAIGAARRAGEIVVRSLDRVGGITVSEKSRNDFVTEVDRQAEQVLIAAVRKAYPAHGFLAEESGEHPGDEYTWVIDPLDGTTNFLHGFPQFAVSVACRHRGRAEVARRARPAARRTVHGRARRRRAARRTAAARLAAPRSRRRADRHGISVPREPALAQALPRNARERDGRDRRRAPPGAASLDLAYVAAGRLDGFWEIGLAPWDTAAGNLLISEAGGRIGNLAGGDYVDGGHLLAGTPRVYTALIELLAPFLDDELRK